LRWFFAAPTIAPSTREGSRLSVIAFANMMNAREESSEADVAEDKMNPIAAKDYIVVLAGLVPVEVLALHAFIVDATTDRSKTDNTTVITDPSTLKWSFWGLIAMCVFLYVVVHFKNLDRYDIVRAAIPAAAFVTWTMVQSTTAFDAVAGGLKSAPRSVIPAFAAVVLGALAQGVTTKANQKTPAARPSAPPPKGATRGT
jgi:hypothetical protein